jgi:basic amino acid/polyamine antiporter, APA family
MTAKLLRSLGPWDLTSIGINGVIGSGIFILPATVAYLVGTWSPLAYLFSGLVTFLIALCFAEAASHFTTAGGPYVYAREAFGPFVGFQVGWITWLVRATSAGAVSHAFATYLGYFFPFVLEGSAQAVITSTVLLSLMLINLVGVRYGAWSVNIFTLGKLLPLGVFVGVGIFHLQAKNLIPLGWSSIDHFGKAALLLIFAFGGFENLTIPAEEAAEPQRDIPKALLATMTLVTITYVLIQIVAVGTFAGLAESKAPLASACAEFLGPMGGTLITWGALVSTTGTLSGLMLTGPRLTYALAQHGQLPALFGKVHSRFRTPVFSIVFYGAVSLGLTLSGTFIQLAGLSAIARLLQYVATCLALLRLRKMKSTNEKYFQMPLARVIPYLGVLLCFWLLFQSIFSQLFLSAGAIFLGCLLYLAGLLGSNRNQRAEAPVEPRA